MGWTGQIPRYFSLNGSIDRKKECDAYCDNWVNHKILESTMVGSTYFAAVENTENNKREVFALVIITNVIDEGKYKEFQYKDMSEDVGPNEDYCPLNILKLLTPTDNEYALNWRRRCYKRHGKNMPQGQYVTENLF